MPEGFEVSLYADDTLAHDIYSMTIDAQGRVVVAGAGYVKILHDDDDDGRADRATLFSSVPASGAHGMYFDGPDLICTGDNSVMRQRDTDGDGVADGPIERWTELRHPEHGANGISRGPDGCYYIICGNDAGVCEKQITTAGSPVKEPRCGAVVRLAPDGKPLDVYAHGFRNPYDLDFDAAGRLYTVDADGERDHHLPWYAPTRLFDIAQGHEHGWLLMGWTRGWNRPPSLFDSMERIVEIGRGSPTGLVVYRHRAFGPHYRGGVFSACWSLGCVYFMPLEAAGATSRSKLETFLRTTGDVGFAPCDLAVGPAGDLFIAIGGRRTRGSVFRVHATKTGVTLVQNATNRSTCQAFSPPISRWPVGRALAGSRPPKSSASPRSKHAAADESLTVEQRSPRHRDRRRALRRSRHRLGRQDRQLSAAATACPHRLGTRQGRASRRCRSPPFATHGRPGSHGATCRLGIPGPGRRARRRSEIAARLEPGPQQPRASRAHRRDCRGPRSRRRQLRPLEARDVPTSRQLNSAEQRRRLAALWIKRSDDPQAATLPFSADELQTCTACLAAAGDDAPLALEAIRLLQLGLGDVRIESGQAEVYCGYVAKLADQLDPATRTSLASKLSPAFPTKDPEVNRELARLLGMLAADDPSLPAAVVAQCTDKSTVEDDVHYLIVLSLLPAKRTSDTTAATARALLGLHAKLDALEQFASRNWPLRVGEMFDALCQRDPNLARAVVDSEAFGHVEHVLFVKHLPKELQADATRKLWTATITRGDEPTSDLVGLVGRLPTAEARPLVLSQWEHPGLRDAIVLVLAKSPQPEDRQKFVEALASPQSLVVERAAGALVPLGINCTSDELAAALRALKQACGAPKELEPRRSLVYLLNYWTEENSDVEQTADPAETWQPWYQLFADYYPAAAARLASGSTTDENAWRQRLAGVSWTSGEAQRGRAVFERRACHRCHEQSGHLGPELKGTAGRFARDDLFAAIYDPNREVSPTYQTTLIATSSGQVYHGLIVYESPEVTLLQTAPDVTVRVNNTDRSAARPSNQSLMPTGLLDTLSDQDLSDLYAYLRTLAPKQ